MIETVETCGACGEVTPHRRRRCAPLRWLAAASAIFAVAAWGTDLDAYAAGTLSFVSLLVALGLFQTDRQRRWDLACARCQDRARAAGRPRLTPHTIIDPLL